MDVREALELWPMMNEAQRHDAAELMRPGVVTIATRNLGARTAEEVRWALAVTAAGCQAGLAAAAPRGAATTRSPLIASTSRRYDDNLARNLPTKKSRERGKERPRELAR